MQKLILKFIIRMLKFFCFATLIYIFSVVVFRRLSPTLFSKNIIYKKGGTGFLYTRLLEADSVKNIDVLAIGSSHAYRGFDPRIFKEYGYKLFNLGSSNQTPIQTNLFLKRYLKKLNPKLVIIEVYPWSLCNDGVESALNIISNTNVDLKVGRMALAVHHLKVYNSLIYGLSEDLLNQENFTETIKTETDKYISGGFVERLGGFYSQKVSKEGRKKWIINEIQWEYLKKNIQILKEKEINYLLVQAPTTKLLFNSYSNNNSIDSILNSLGPYLNFNLTSNMNDSLHFYDSDHLNQNGVEIFNTSLLENKLMESLKNR
jgi:hypothetical protein